VALRLSPALRAYGSAEESFSLLFPALALQRALRASGPCRAIFGRPAQAGLDRGMSGLMLLQEAFVN